MRGSNGQVIVVSEGREDFNLALKLAFDGKTAVGYRIDLKPKFREDAKNVSAELPPTPLFEIRHPRMILYWTEPSETINKGYVPLPYRMSAEEVSHLAYGWLLRQDYGEEPDHDGSNGRGFAVYNESWEQVAHEWQAMCAVSPQWAWYPK